MFNLFNKSPAAAQPDARELVRMVTAGEAVLVDVREAGEFRSGHAKGAVHIPLATVRMKTDPSSPECHPALKAGKPVVVYCASGARSNMAAGQMRQLGQQAVYNLGGLFHWQSAGGAVA